MSSIPPTSLVQPPRLERLRPVTVQPMRLTERPAALRTLQQIDLVGIQRTRSQQGRSPKLFVIDICFKRSRRIPVLASRTIASQLNRTVSCSTPAPDVHVDRTFGAIRELRDTIYYCASKDHGLKPCAYCSAIVDFILLRSTTPSITTQWLQNETTQCQTLTTFLQQLLQLAMEAKTSLNNEPCTNQQRIPEIICEFLAIGL